MVLKENYFAKLGAKLRMGESCELRKRWEEKEKVWTWEGKQKKVPLWEDGAKGGSSVSRGNKHKHNKQRCWLGEAEI